MKRWTPARLRVLCWAHPAHALSFGLGSGLSPKAPGTVGTLWAWGAYHLMAPHLNDGGWAAVLLLSLALGVAAARTTAAAMAVDDPSAIVWDEVVAFWLILWLAMPLSLLGQLLVFALFRYFDAAKPGPVAWADRVFKGRGWRGAWGIFFDDLVAALCTLLVLAFWRWGNGY